MPDAGLVSLIEFFNKAALASKITQAMLFTLTSANDISLARTLMAFLNSVIAGAKRLARHDCIRFDAHLHFMLGIG
jgi:hypothetical protein